MTQGINILATDDHVWLFMWALGTWKGIGYSAIIYLSAISAIDQELYESSEIDGAGRFQKIRHITIPSLMPTFITLLILSIASILSVILTSSLFSRILLIKNTLRRWIYMYIIWESGKKYIIFYGGRYGQESDWIIIAFDF